MAKIWNRIKNSTSKVGGGVPVWSEPNQPRMTIGGLVMNDLQDMEVISAGSPLEYNYKTKQAKFLRLWEVVSQSGDDVVIKATARTPEIRVGMNVLAFPSALNGTGTSVAVTAVVEDAATSTATITVASIGTLTAGDFIAEADKLGAGATLYAVPNGISIDDTVGGDINFVGVARGMKYIYENTIPAMPALVKEAIPFVEWDWFNE